MRFIAKRLLVALFFCLGMAALAGMPITAGAQTPEPSAPQPAAPETAPPEKMAPEPQPVPPPPGKSAPPDIPMEAFGTAHPECMEWLDSCRICQRDAQNEVSCSTPGIACIPGEISCKTTRGK